MKPAGKPGERCAYSRPKKRTRYTEGRVYGMQFATNHLHLGFDMKDKELIIDGKRTKVSNSPFLHVGICVHVDKIKEFLREKDIRFTETD